MTSADLIAILPLVVLAGAPVLAMLAIAVRRSHVVTAAIVLSGLVAAGVLGLVAAARPARNVTPLLVVDRFSLFYIELAVLAAIAVVLMAYRYLEGREEKPEEFHVLLLIATFGSAVLVSSRHFASLFLGLETLAVSLYGLIAYVRSDGRALEAGLKYVILAGASSAFLLLGIALVYASAGTLSLSGVAATLTESSRTSWVVPGMALVLVGIGFELALVPFHTWTPDVYEGAPAPVGAFVATVSKGTVLALLLRYCVELGILRVPSATTLVVVLAVASMLVGNFLALRQDNVKRILAYSSIAHVGYALVGLLSASTTAVASVSFYLATYFATMLTAFGVLTVLSTREGDIEALEALRGLFWRRPLLATALSTALFSLAGIPLTAGFFGKYYVVLAGVGAQRWLAVLVLVAGSVVGLYYYLRIIVVMYGRTADDAETEPAPPLPFLSLLSGGVLCALFLVLLWWGVYPSPVIRSVLPSGAGLGLLSAR